MGLSMFMGLVLVEPFQLASIDKGHMLNYQKRVMRLVSGNNNLRGVGGMPLGP
jgi:hypothetical protein